MARFWTHLVRAATMSTAALICTLTLSLPSAASPALPYHQAPLASADHQDSDASQSGANEENATARPQVVGDSGENDGLLVEINRVLPAVLTTEDQIQLTVSLTNTSDEIAQDVTLTVGMQARTPVTTTQLTQFLSGELGNGITIAEVKGPSRLAAGDQWNTVITVKRDVLPLGSNFQWGPRGLSVQAGAANGDVAGTGRSLIIWDSDYPVEPTFIGALVALTQQSDIPDATTLSHLVTTPGVTMAVDAALLDPSSQITNDELPMSGASTLKATESDPLSVISETQKVLLTQSNEIAVLPRQDADLGVLANGGAQSLTTLAQESVTSATNLRDSLLKGHLITASTTTADSRPSPTPSPSSTATSTPAPAASASPSPSTQLTVPGSHADNQTMTPVQGDASPMMTSVVWPDASSFGLQVLQESDKVVIAPPGALAPTEDLTFTSVSPVNVDPETGATALPEGEGTTVLTSVKDLSDLLTWQPQGQADQFLADQALNALTAIITREKPNESRTLLATVPRGTVADQTLTDRLSTLLTARWVRPETLSEVASSEVTDVDRGVVEKAAWSEQDQQAIESIQNATNRLFQMADSAVKTDEVRNLVRDHVLGAVSASQKADLTSSATALNTLATQWYAQVKVDPTTTVNLINKTAQFPVRVTNNLEWDVRVQVTLDPEDNRLSAQPSEITVVPAGHTTTIDVPVSAIGSGDISVGYRLTTADGFIIDQSQSVIVRLRAGWEDRFTLALAIAFLILFVVGIVRTVRKRIKNGSTIVGTSHTSGQALAQHGALENHRVKEDHEPQ